MCGIAGLISKTESRIDQEASLERFHKSMQHRGPNHFGPHVGINYAVANLRLAIVDIAQGNQPMYSPAKDWGIVYNGEIYNHNEMREELLNKGYVFHTHSDTEVVLNMFLEYGFEAFNRFNGMFGICLFKTDGSEFVLVRDGFGIKPLYLYEDSDKFYFSSEIKGILAQEGVDKSLSAEGVQDYAFYRYIVSPLTLFKKIKAIEPGTYVHIKNSKAVTWRFFDISYSNKFQNINFEEAKQNIDVLMQKAVQSQLMGEVPVGVLLSGGIDSSAIAYYVSKNGANLTTYNIGFPEVNEFEYSRAVAKKFGLKYVEVETSVDELVKDFESVMNAIDHPMADPACFPLYALCKELKKDVIVVLSGEGGDEQFGGYNQYKHLLNSVSPFDQRYTEFLNRSFYFFENLEVLKNSKEIAPRIHKSMKYFDENTPLNGMLAFDLRTWMPDNLMMKADKILMSHSLEGRFPFLDKNLFEFVSGLPEDFKIKNKDITKYILKELTIPHLPKNVVNRPKMGFTVPVDVLLHRLKPKVIESVHWAEKSEIGEILNIHHIHKIVDRYYRGELKGQDLKVWSWFILLDWVKNNLN